MPNTNGHDPKRTVLYARVSTDEQGKSGYSIPNQLRRLREYAGYECLKVIEEIVDDGYSGGSAIAQACTASWSWRRLERWSW